METAAEQYLRIYSPAFCRVPVLTCLMGPFRLKAMGLAWNFSCGGSNPCDCSATLWKSCQNTVREYQWKPFGIKKKKKKKGEKSVDAICISLQLMNLLQMTPKGKKGYWAFEDQDHWDRWDSDSECDSTLTRKWSWERPRWTPPGTPPADSETAAPHGAAQPGALGECHGQHLQTHYHKTGSSIGSLTQGIYKKLKNLFWQKPTKYGLQWAESMC